MSPEAQVATAIYDHTEGMVEFIAMQGIAKRALRTKGADVNSVIAAMVSVYDNGKPIVFQTVGQALGTGVGNAGVSTRRTSTADQRAQAGYDLADELEREMKEPVQLSIAGGIK